MKITLAFADGEEREARIIRRFAEELCGAEVARRKGPCNLCWYGPPAGHDGEPCTICSEREA